MADTQYTPFPTVNPSAQPLPQQSVPLDEEMAGAGIGQSLQRTGAVMRQAQEQEFALELRFAEMEAETRALDAATAYTQQSNKIINDFRQLNGQQAVDALPGVEKSLVELDREIGKGLRSPVAQRAYKQRASNILSSNLQVAGIHSGTEAGKANDAAKSAAIQAAQSRFANHFGLAPTKPDIDEIVSLTSRLAFERGLPKEAADVLIQKNVGDALAAVMGAKVFQGRSAEARAIFEQAVTEKIPGTDLPMFSGERMAELGMFVKRAEEAEALDKIQAEQRAHAAAEGERRKTQDDFLKKMQAGNLSATEVLASNLDPFGSGSKEQFLQMLKVGASGGEMKTNNELYIQLFDRIHMPDGFPGKLTDENELNQYMGRGLNPVSINQLRAEIQGKRTQEGSVESELKKNFLTMARNQISGTNQLLGIADPRGDQKYFEFLQYFLGAYDKAVRAGGNPAELLDPSGVFFKSVQQYIRTPQEYTRDLQMGGPTTPTPTAPPTRIDPVPTGVPTPTGTLGAQPAGLIEPPTENPRDVELFPVWPEPKPFSVNGKVYLLPTLVGGKRLTNQEAINRFTDSGLKKHNGQYASVADANAALANVTPQAAKPKRPANAKFSPSTRSWWWQDSSGNWVTESANVVQ